MSESLPEHTAATIAEAPGLVNRAINAIVSACMAVAGVMLVVLIATMGWLVFGRYVLNDTPTWVEQLSLILVVWITFLGGTASVWRKAHLGVDFIRDMMPEPIRTLLRLLAAALMLLFAICMAWQGSLLAEGTWARRIPMLDISEGWRAVPMAISGALVALFSLIEIVTVVMATIARKGRETGD